jgi:AmiR/NasT family two-component response regulator
VVSADATALQMERMLSLGAKAYLTKPLDIQQLLDVLDEAIGKGARDKLRCLEV